MPSKIHSLQFWHMQLHSDKKLSNDVIKYLVSEKSLIGMARSWKNKNGSLVQDPYQFKNVMKKGDVVLIRNGRLPIALVKVTGDVFLKNNTNENLDWFPLRRKVKLLSFFEEKAEEILKNTLSKFNRKQIQALGTLTLCSKPSATKTFIKTWYESLNDLNAR